MALSSRKRKNIDGKRKKAVTCSFFCQHMFAVLFAIDATIKLTGEESGWTVSGFRVVCMALSTWSLLYFVQLLPSIGYFVVAIQQMVRQMFNFGVVYSICFFAAFHPFFVTVNTSERQTCSGEFSNMSQGIYSKFAIVLNLVNPAQLGLRHPGWFYVTPAGSTSPRLDLRATRRLYAQCGDPTDQLPPSHHDERLFRGGATATDHRAAPATVCRYSDRVFHV